MKFGIDVHKVIDAKPKLFAMITDRLINNGHEVHIITGSMQTPNLENHLRDLGIKWTHFFSVSDYLIGQGEKVKFTDPSNPWFRSEEWNKTKAEYCLKEQIDLHIDDSDIYGNFFKTPYLRFIYG